MNRNIELSLQHLPANHVSSAASFAESILPLLLSSVVPLSEIIAQSMYNSIDI